MFSSLQKIIEGEIDTTNATLNKYSHDASLIEIRPQAVIYPKNSDDVKNIVEWVNLNKIFYPNLSITARCAGTCMSGGSINDSIILDFTRYMGRYKQLSKEKHIFDDKININNYPNGVASIITEPGLFYRILEKYTIKNNLIMPAFTASKDLNAMGGMFGNNSGGEKSIKFGKTEDYILETKTIFSDGHEYTVKPLTENALKEKIMQPTFEGKLYRQIYDLIESNYDLIKASRPNVSKNSAGYYLWNVWDRSTGIFDLNKLLVGSQGTLGLTTEITWKLVPYQTHQKMVVVFLDNLTNLGNLVTEILKHNPDSVEAYDDQSMKLAVKFFGSFIKSLGLWETIKLGYQFLPEAWMLLKGGMPKLVVITEFVGNDEEELDLKVKSLYNNLKKFNYDMRIPKNDADEKKYWKIRHESFNLLRQHVRGMRTAPFIDDFIINPKYLPQFLPELQNILKDYDFNYTIAGHAGNGNFHIIPLMDMTNPANTPIIDELSNLVYDLVLKYDGSITAEHNDGIVRTPYLSKMFGPDVYQLFMKTKQIFDPENIFNPNKKVGTTKEFFLKNISKNNKHT